MATEKQIEFIESLAVDCSFNRRQRNDYISTHIGREIKFLDELTTKEASFAIDLLKSKRSNLIHLVEKESLKDEEVDE